MNQLLTMFLTTAKAKVMPLWTKARLWTSSAFLRAVVLAKIREFFTTLLDVKPRHKRDYYSVFRWLVSKRLAVALVVGLAILSGIYIASMLPLDSLFGSARVRTYKYRSLPLKFCSGQVNILARDGHLAYTGEVSKGAAEGSGLLYTGKGQLLYEGFFSNSKFDGSGTLYYDGELPRYVGDFHDNVFHGLGSYYRPNGVLEYSGDYVMGVRSGTGTLFNSTGEPVYTGDFRNDDIVYHGFLDHPTGDLAQMYSGDSYIYQTDDEYCVSMPEIHAVCAVDDGSNKLENEWTISSVYILSDRFHFGGVDCTTVNELTGALGQPLYFGTSWVQLPEAVAINALDDTDRSQLGAVDMVTENSFDEVFNVSSYDRNHEVYLYTYEQEGLLYTFFTAGAGLSRFLLYQITKA